jgi:hypothetical protein
MGNLGIPCERLPFNPGRISFSLLGCNSGRTQNFNCPPLDQGGSKAGPLGVAGKGEMGWFLRQTKDGKATWLKSGALQG